MKCERCNGMGWELIVRDLTRECPACHGTGDVPAPPAEVCPSCRGEHPYCSHGCHAPPANCQPPTNPTPISSDYEEIVERSVDHAHKHTMMAAPYGDDPQDYEVRDLEAAAREACRLMDERHAKEIEGLKRSLTEARECAARAVLVESEEIERLRGLIRHYKSAYFGGVPRSELTEQAEIDLMDMTDATLGKEE